MMGWEVSRGVPGPPCLLFAYVFLYLLILFFFMPLASHSRLSTLVTFFIHGLALVLCDCLPHSSPKDLALKPFRGRVQDLFCNFSAGEG